MHLPPGGDWHASHPTEQFWSAPAQPGAVRPEQPGHDPLRQHYSHDRRKALHWSVGVAAVLLACGGAVAGISLAGSSSPAAAPAAATAGTPAAGAGTAAGPAGQAAVLNTVLSSASSPAAPGYLDSTGAVAAAAGSSPGGTAAGLPAGRRCVRARAAARAAGLPRIAHAIRRACRRGLVLRRLALHGLHGEFTFRTASGFRALAFERGTIQSVSTQDVVVRAADGTTWTWDLVSSTVVRANGHKTGASALAGGEQIWAGGRVTSGAKDARLIVIRPRSVTPAPSPSSAAS